MYYVITYVITVETKDQHHPHYEASVQSERKARAMAEKWAEEHPDKLVFVRFHRGSDGQTGYINRNGAAITGTSWTIAD